MIGRISFVVLVTVVTSQKHGLDTTVCHKPTASTPGGMKRPSLPDTFSTQVEVNILNKNLTTQIHEFHDGPHNRAAAHQWYNGTELHAIASFATNELITYYPIKNGLSMSLCYVVDLRKNTQHFIFGMKSFANGTDRVYSAAGALGFGGNLKEQYMGQTPVRGIMADHWRSCAYWQDMDSTMVVDWYFSVKEWFTPTGDSQIPLRCHVKGVRWDTKSESHPFEHIYEFNEFRRGASPHHFEVPRGIYCPDRKSTKPPPKANKYFSFGAEVMVPETHRVNYLKEQFDYKTKMVRLDYKPDIFSGVNNVVHRTSEIHDFNTGVAYVTDLRTGNCTFKTIPTTGFDAQPLSNNSNLAEIRTGFEYFFTDSSINTTYSGMRTVRGIECDVWIAVKNDWPPGQPTKSTWEWYFARPGWVQTADIKSEFGVPIRIEITTYGYASSHFIYNIYDYNEEEPNFWTFDISNCYNYDNKVFIRFLLPGNYTQLVLPNESIFKYLVLISITGYTHISPIRVSEIKLDHSSKYILVSLFILGPAPIRGDVQNYPEEPSLTLAVDVINGAIRKGKFVVAVDKISLMHMTPITAVPYSDTLWGYEMATMVPIGPAGPPPESDAERESDDVERVTDDADVDKERDSGEERETGDEERILFDAEGDSIEAESESKNEVYGLSQNSRNENEQKEELLTSFQVRSRRHSVSGEREVDLAVTSCSPQAPGYSSGALAGIAIGMLALGFLVVFVAMMFGPKLTRLAVIENQGYEMQ